MLVVSEDERLRIAISESLWTSDPTTFLAHDQAGSERDAGQPILIHIPCLVSLSCVLSSCRFELIRFLISGLFRMARSMRVLGITLKLSLSQH